MSASERLPREFFARHTLQVAPQLLGQRLVHLEGSERTSGIILEVEAYRGEEDQACHARFGLTPRTKIMYGLPGCAYVYFTYGMHWMLNVVTEEEGFPAAVLIRAILPLEGLARIAARRDGQPPEHWTDGPAKICQALDIDGRLNGGDLCDPHSVLFIERGWEIPEAMVTTSSRVGLFHVPEPWKSIPWRFSVREEWVRAMLIESGVRG